MGSYTALVFQYLWCCAVVELTPQVGPRHVHNPCHSRTRGRPPDVHDLDPQWWKPAEALASVLTVSPLLPGPLSQIKSSLLGSTSDSNLNKYSTINKIPLIALNFSEANNEKKCPSPPSSEKTIIAPKVKDRTHNVTDKVTQVRMKFRLVSVRDNQTFHLFENATQVPLDSFYTEPVDQTA